MDGSGHPGGAPRARGRRGLSAPPCAWALARGLLVGTLLLTGCTRLVFRPTGDDLALSASWTIDGASPTEASCAALGIATVRVVLYENEDGNLDYRDERLEAPCAQGAILTQPILDRGFYYAGFDALNADGKRIYRSSERVAVFAPDAGSVSLPPHDIDPLEVE